MFREICVKTLSDRKEWSLNRSFWFSRLEGENQNLESKYFISYVRLSCETCFYTTFYAKGEFTEHY